MLDLTNIISISVSEAPIGLGAFNINNLALFTDDPTPEDWDAGQEYGVYVSPQAVGEDFGTDSETYLQAVAVFSQNPNILAAGGSLIVIPLVPGSSSSSSSSSSAAGASSGSGAIINPETLIEAIARTHELIFYCGIISTKYPASASMKALADVIQSYPDKILFLPSDSTTDITGAFTQIKDASDYQTRCLYYGNDEAVDARLFAAAYAGRALSVDFAGSLTAITMNLKSLQTIDPDESLTQTLYTALQTAGVDGYADYAGVSSVICNGANKFFDEVYNLIWFVSQLKVNGFNALRQVGTKIPQTEPGMSVLKGAYRSACEQAFANGYVAPGAWTSSEWFGNQEDFYQNILQRGYYIYSQPVNLQPVADREAREAPLVQIAVKQAGAIQSSNVIVTVNR